jgi:hypothetical protein
VMEDFYANMISLKPAGMFSLKPWIALEVAKIKGEICFFAAVPKKYAGFVEKKINSIYSDAQIERSDDFNIFGYKEKVYCGYLKTAKSVYLPIKTFNYIEVDPLSSITNTLTKLAEHEEAAVQICLRNTSDNWQIRGREILKLMRQGENILSSAECHGVMASVFRQSQKRRRAPNANASRR